MMTLQMPPPKVAILLEEVFGIAQECSRCGIGQSQRIFRCAEPFMNMSQMVASLVGFIRLGEQVIGEWGFVGDSFGNVCCRLVQTWNCGLEWVEDMHEHVYLVNPIVKLWVFCGLSIFVGRLFWSSGEAVGAMLGTGNVNESEVE